MQESQTQARHVKQQVRRRILRLLTSLAAMPAVFGFGPSARAQTQLYQPPGEIVPAILDLTKGAVVMRGRVKLDLPRLADNGNSVACRITVQSPMNAQDYVRGIQLFSEKNPRPVIARFFLGPVAGRAEIATRIRLAGSQRVVAVAEMSDGSFWSDTTEVAVTISACYDAA